MTYERALRLCLRAGVGWDEACQIARDAVTRAKCGTGDARS